MKEKRSIRDNCLFLIILLLMCGLMRPGAAPAAELVVTNNQDAGTGSLRAAIAAAQADDVIVFDGDYAITLDSTLEIDKNLTIDGAGRTVVVSGGNAVRVFEVSAGNVALNNMAITEGKGINSTSGGGLITQSGATVAVSNCTFTDSQVDDGGGGIANFGTMTVQNSDIHGNSAECAGGGVYNEGGDMTMIDCKISNNTIPDTSCEGGGGGVANWNNSTMTLRNCDIFGNVSETYAGGGLENYSSSLTLVDCVIRENTSAGGGGISGYYKFDLTLLNCVVSNNESSWRGGGVLIGDTSSNRSTMTLTNCAFFGNSAAKEGGAIGNDLCAMTITSCTLYSNSAAEKGGGIYSNIGSSTLVNSILWGNNATIEGLQVYYVDSPPDISFSNIQGSGGSGASWDGSLGADGGGNIDDDPLFMDAAAGDLHPQNGSPVINAGNNAALPPDTTDMDDDANTTEAIPCDLDHNPRVIAGTADMGAYETGDDYTLTYTAGAGGSITGDVSQTVSYGNDGAPVTAAPDGGYYFVNWSDGKTANPRTDVNVTKDIAVTANFNAGADIDGDIDGSGSVDLGDAIAGLRILAGAPQPEINPGADVNHDLMIGLEEVIFALQDVAELRQP